MMHQRCRIFGPVNAPATNLTHRLWTIGPCGTPDVGMNVFARRSSHESCAFNRAFAKSGEECEGWRLRAWSSGVPYPTTLCHIPQRRPPRRRCRSFPHSQARCSTRLMGSIALRSILFDKYSFRANTASRTRRWCLVCGHVWMSDSTGRFVCTEVYQTPN